MSPTKASTGFTTQCNRNINDQHTEFVFQRFANRWFLLITQYSKVPNLYTVQFDVQRNDEVPSSAVQQPIDHPTLHMSVPLTMKCNFGADKDEVRSAIQFLVNKTNLKQCPNEDFVIGLGLKEINGQQLREVAKVLNEIIK